MRFLRSTAAVAAVAAAMLSQNATAVNLSTDGIGEVAIAPYYTSRDNWQTLINLVNTQNVPVVVKVRFHEALNSRDVFDFTVAMSALDTFVGVVREGANGTPEFVNVDAPNNDGRITCTIPNIPQGTAVSMGAGLGGFSGLDYAGDSNDDGGIQTDDRLKEGYIEFIVEGYADSDITDTLIDLDGSAGPGAAANVITVAGGAAAYTAASTAQRREEMGYAIETHDCQTVRSGFLDANVLGTAKQFGEPINALKFNFALLNIDKGVEVGYSATTWANFYNPGNGSGAFPDQLEGLVEPFNDVLCDIDRGSERDSDVLGTGTLVNWCPDGSSSDACGATPVVADLGVLGGSCRNLITAQQPDAFLEPTLNDAYPALASGWYDPQNIAVTVAPDATLETYRGEQFANALEALRGVDALSLTIQRSSIINDWSVNPALGVSTDWVVTQPTKAFYVDQGAGAQFQVITKDVNPDAVLSDVIAVKGRDEAVYAVADTIADPGLQADVVNTPYAPYQTRFAQTTLGSRPSAKACNQIAFDLRDRAEQGNEGADEEEPVFSPSLPVATVVDQLCYETTVINFEDRSGNVPTVLGDALNRLVVPTDNLITTDPQGQTFGWMSLQLDTFAGAAMLIDSPFPVSAVRGLPVIGVNFKALVLPDNAQKSYATAADHSYARRTVTP